MSCKVDNVIFVSQAANLYGSERTLLTLLEGEFPKGLRPLVVCPTNGPLCESLDKLHIERIPWAFNIVTLRSNPFWHCRFFIDFCRLLRQRRPKAVVIVYLGNVPLLVAASRLCRVPVYRIMQIGVSRIAHLRWFCGFNTDRMAFRLSDGIFCGAQTLRDQLQQNYRLGDYPQRALVYLPVRTESPEVGDAVQWRHCHNIPLDVHLVGQFSRLHPVKGVGILLQAAKKILQQTPNVWFVICGGSDGSQEGAHYMEELQRMLVSFHLCKRVIFTGRVEDIFTAMSSCDVVVLPSFSEGLPISCLEAMLIARPMVGSNVDGLGEAITASGGGFTFPAGDVECLAGKIVKLLNNPALRASLGKSGQQWVLRNCSPKSVSEHFLENF